jgi:hypothetical protein
MLLLSRCFSQPALYAEDSALTTMISADSLSVTFIHLLAFSAVVFQRSSAEISG